MIKAKKISEKVVVTTSVRSEREHEGSKKRVEETTVHFHRKNGGEVLRLTSIEGPCCSDYILVGIQHGGEVEMTLPLTLHDYGREYGGFYYHLVVDANGKEMAIESHGGCGEGLEAYEITDVDYIDKNVVTHCMCTWGRTDSRHDLSDRVSALR